MQQAVINQTQLSKKINLFFEFLYEKYWRVNIFGLEHIPKTGAALLVANHSGMLPYDAGMLKIALQKYHPAKRELYFLVEDFIEKMPWLKNAMDDFGGVCASPDAASQLIQQGRVAIVFPEGVKGLGKLHKDRYQLARFGRGGFIRIALKEQTPLVPVVFVGAEDIHPVLAKETFLSRILLGIPYFPFTWTFPWLGPLGLIPLRSRWSIHVLPPMDFSAYGPECANDRVLVHQLALKVKNSIQETLYQQLALRSTEDRVRLHSLSCYQTKNPL